jgi:hypothetical protein
MLNQADADRKYYQNSVVDPDQRGQKLPRNIENS